MASFLNTLFGSKLKDQKVSGTEMRRNMIKPAIGMYAEHNQTRIVGIIDGLMQVDGETHIRLVTPDGCSNIEYLNAGEFSIVDKMTYWKFVSRARN